MKTFKEYINEEYHFKIRHNQLNKNTFDGDYLIDAFNDVVESYNKFKCTDYYGFDYTANSEDVFWNEEGEYVDYDDSGALDIETTTDINVFFNEVERQLKSCKREESVIVAVTKNVDKAPLLIKGDLKKSADQSVPDFLIKHVVETSIDNFYIFIEEEYAKYVNNL